MAKKDIQESQQSSQGIAIGTQGNQAGSIPEGVKGNHQSKNRNDAHPIPNQERSSSSERNRNQGDQHKQ